jgi:hypothetical protein
MGCLYGTVTEITGQLRQCTKGFIRWIAYDTVIMKDYCRVMVFQRDNCKRSWASYGSCFDDPFGKLLRLDSTINLGQPINIRVE